MIDVLILEDEEDLAEIYKEICEQVGFTSITLSSAGQISTFISSNMPFKIGIFDLNLGIIPINGRYLMDIFAMKGITFTTIVISGEISVTDHIAFRDKGVEYILQKPIAYERINEILVKLKKKLSV